MIFNTMSVEILHHVLYVMFFLYQRIIIVYKFKLYLDEALRNKIE